MKRKIQALAVVFASCCAVAALSGCKKETPGEKLDKAIDNTKDAAKDMKK